MHVVVVLCKSIQCTSCQKWVHKNCSGIKGNMFEVILIYLERLLYTGSTSVDVDASAISG